MNKKEIYLTKTPVVWGLAMICCLLWGSAFPCIKIGYQLLKIPSGAAASQLLFAGCRFTLAGILVLLFGSIKKKKLLWPKKGSCPYILKLALFQTILQYLFFYIGLAHTSGVKSSIIVASNVFLSILFSCFYFHYENLNRMKILGCLTGFAGVVMINLTGGGMDGGMSFQGEGAVLLSTIAYAFAAGLMKRYGKKEDTLVLSGWQFLAGGLVLIGIALTAGGRLQFSFSSFLLLLYMAFISAAAFSIWGILLKYNPVGKVAVFGFMNPIFGVFLSALLLGEKNQAFGIQGILALVFVCSGIFFINQVSAD